MKQSFNAVKVISFVAVVAIVFSALVAPVALSGGYYCASIIQSVATGCSPVGYVLSSSQDAGADRCCVQTYNCGGTVVCTGAFGNNCSDTLYIRTQQPNIYANMKCSNKLCDRDLSSGTRYQGGNFVGVSGNQYLDYIANCYTY